MFRKTFGLIALLFATAALAEDFRADPATYERLLRALKPGDRLLLGPGTYRAGLTLYGTKGTAASPIEIRGPSEGPPAIFVARLEHDTVSLSNTAFVQIRHLVLDGGGLPVDAVKASASKRCLSVHDIVLENLLIVGHGADQQVVGIASFCPAWNWTIRRNVIIGAGTGLYLGQSDGTAPFVAGVIEQNVIVDTRGYNLQIKHQKERPMFGGMPAGFQKTIVRHNVFTKVYQASADKEARPNVLLGHFPLSGEGSQDIYEVTDNVFFCSPGESLLQGEGNLDISGNIFINPSGDGVSIQPHRDVPRRIALRRNFVAAARAATHVVTATTAHPVSVTENRIVSAEVGESEKRRPNTAEVMSAALPVLQQWLKSRSRSAPPRDFRPLIEFAGPLCSAGTVATPSAGTIAYRLVDHPACRLVTLVSVVNDAAKAAAAVTELVARPASDVCPGN